MDDTYKRLVVLVDSGLHAYLQERATREGGRSVGSLVREIISRAAQSETPLPTTAA